MAVDGSDGIKWEYIGLGGIKWSQTMESDKCQMEPHASRYRNKAPGVEGKGEGKR